MDKPLLLKSAVGAPLQTNQGDKLSMIIKTSNLPVNVKSPVLPSGHHLQIPAHAEVKSMPASSLPPSIQQKILAAATASSSGTPCTNAPNVIYVSPVNTVKTDASNPLPNLYPKPQTSNCTPLISTASQEPRNCPVPEVKTINNQEAQQTPIKWVVRDSPQSESQCLVPVRSASNIASKLLKTLADIKTSDTYSESLISLCSSSTSATKTKNAPIKENALVMFDGKVYLLAKKGVDALKTETEKTHSSNLKAGTPLNERRNSDSLNQISNKVVDMVLSKNKRENSSLADHMNTCTSAEMGLQPKIKEAAVLSQVGNPHGDKESHPRIVSTIRINTNGKCTIESNFPIHSKNCNTDIDRSAIQPDNGTTKTSSIQSENGVLKNVEVMTGFEPETNKKSKPKQFDNSANAQISKGEEAADKDLKNTITHEPVVQAAESSSLQQVSTALKVEDSKEKTKMIDCEDSAKTAFSKEEHEDKEAASTNLPILNQMPSGDSSILNADLKIVPNDGNSKRRKTCETFTGHENTDSASTSHSFLDNTLLPNSNLAHQQTVKVPKKGKSTLKDKGKAKRKRGILRYAFSKYIVPSKNDPSMLEQNCLQQVGADLKPIIYKKRKTKHVDDISDTRRPQSEEAFTMSEDFQIANNRPPLLDQTHSQGSKPSHPVTSELKPQCPKKRELKLCDDIKISKTIEKECPLNQDSTTASPNLPTSLQPLSQCLNFLEVDHTTSPSSSSMEELPDRAPSPQTWRSTWCAEKYTESSSSFHLLLQPDDAEIIREERIRRLKDRLEEKKQAVEAIRKVQKNV
ncbi:ligand-dependent nuclear receptor-interacting factor 1 isoform X2 [Ambystoma mexicanum]